MTVEEWARYGVGTPDEDGIYPDYRIPADLRPQPGDTPATGRAYWWADLVPHWDLVVRDLADRYGIDLHDPAVHARPWPGVRTLIWGLLREPSRLATALGKG